MNCFTEDHSKLLLGKEWLVKIDNSKSMPYLIKFHSSSADLSCLVLVTDTIKTWAEELTSNQFARRWRECNPSSPSLFAKADEEDEWRSQILQLLSNMHSLGGIADLAFEVQDTRYSDFAFELDGEPFKWRWETCLVGTGMSARILSSHLIMPLISVTHLAFSSAEAVNDMALNELEKAVDKMGRTSRRMVDTHVKHAVGKPRTATTLRRITAMFNFSADLPNIVSEADKPDLLLQTTGRRKPTAALGSKNDASSPPETSTRHSSPFNPSEQDKPRKPVQTDSATDSDSDSPAAFGNDYGKGNLNLLNRSPPPNISNDRVSTHPEKVSSQSKSDGSESSPRPKKKSKARNLSSDGDEEKVEKPDPPQKSDAGAKRGTRQPIKRGGKRF